MMLRCKSVKFGAMPYGPATGQRALEVTIEMDPDSTQGWNREDPREVPCYNQFRDILERESLEAAYTKAIDGTQSVFLIFKGGSIETIDAAEEWNAFATAVTRDNIDFGKQILKLDPAALIKGQIKPPFMIYRGKPTVFTATRDWYQNFNVVLAEIDFTDGAQGVSQVALQEMINHQNGQVMAFVDDVSQLGVFFQPMNQIRKTCVVDVSEVVGQEIFDLCMERNYRYYLLNLHDWKDNPRAIL